MRWTVFVLAPLACACSMPPADGFDLRSPSCAKDTDCSPGKVCIGSMCVFYDPDLGMTGDGAPGDASPGDAAPSDGGVTDLACSPADLPAVAGLNVVVKSAKDNSDVCDATVTARDGAYQETLMAGACQYYGAFERAGNYTVEVSRAGFKTANQTAMVLRGTDCHVAPVKLTFQLTPM